MAREGGAYEARADGTVRRVAGTRPGDGARDAAGRLLDGPPEGPVKPARKPSARKPAAPPPAPEPAAPATGES